MNPAGHDFDECCVIPAGRASVSAEQYLPAEFQYLLNNTINRKSRVSGQAARRCLPVKKYPIRVNKPASFRASRLFTCMMVFGFLVLQAAFVNLST